VLQCAADTWCLRQGINLVNGKVLITGSSGLIGTAVIKRLMAAGIACVAVDLQAADPEDRMDICDSGRIARLLGDVTGIIHLAAVSRVIHGERHPARCRAVNVDATRAIIESALALRQPPWLIYASSREVYGQQVALPVNEDATLRPMNVYAHSKLAAEQLVEQARAASLQTAILRFSTVYGSVNDHHDRVVPAFTAAAVCGEVLRVDGPECCFDITHVDDVASGVIRVAELLTGGERGLPPIHFVSGRGITLLELARMSIELGDSNARIHSTTPHSFDVHRFIGDPARARAILGWEATIDLRSGLSRLAQNFAARLAKNIL
jgi:nucleoside-diphosphate-sugar epimerase